MSRPARLVFVHGAGGTGRAWDLQRFTFPDAVAPDLPGHAEPGPGCRRIEEYGAWLRTTVQARGWVPAVIVGHSMGGAIALWYALAHPEDLAGIVLIATGARLRVHPEILATLHRDYPAAVDRIVTLSLGEGAPARLGARLRDTMLGMSPDVTLGDFEACAAFDVRDRLGAIRLPTHVVAGSKDQMTPPRFAEYLRDHLAGARLVVVAGAGHSVHLERPREVNQAIREFREALSPALQLRRSSSP
ncbi:MAG TPA: alpha/beta hydrolase [bacterium]|nr:alpha/beta hydrolase [bacterium]